MLLVMYSSLMEKDALGWSDHRNVVKRPSQSMMQLIRGKKYCSSSSWLRLYRSQTAFQSWMMAHSSSLKQRDTNAIDSHQTTEPWTRKTAKTWRYRRGTCCIELVLNCIVRRCINNNNNNLIRNRFKETPWCAVDNKEQNSITQRTIVFTQWSPLLGN